MLAAPLGGLACSSEAPQPLAGTPRTGEPPGPDAGPSDAQLHEARVKALLTKAGLGEAELARWRSAPLVDARIEIVPGAGGAADNFVGRWLVAVVNSQPEALVSPSAAVPQVLRSLAFELPVNRVSGKPAAVVLDAVKVDGVTVAAGGTAARWEVPVEVAPGERTEIELTFRGALPPIAVAATPTATGRAGALDLDALLGQLGGSPELRQLVPMVPVVDGAAAYGLHATIAVLAGGMPQLVGAPAGAVHLEVLASPELEIDATGQRVGSEREGARVKHRFVALGEADIAVVASRGLATTTSVVADTPVTFRMSGAVSPELVARLRRALEEYQTRWGRHGPRGLTVIAGDGAAVATLPGFLLVPASMLAALDHGAGAAAGAPVPGLSLSGVLGDMLEHHPAAREALAFALATAVAHEWWAGLGGDAPARTVLTAGFARAGALAVVAGQSGDKAERRALELGLKLPIQLSLERGTNDVALAGLSAASLGDAATASLAELKAGLFVATLARHLGEPTMATLASRLLASPRVTLTAFRSEVLALAPRPDETRVFLARWLDETHLAEEVGPLRPEVLLEYLVSDGAVGSLTSQLMGKLGPGQLGGRALELLGQGQELDAGLALTLLGELAAKDADPAMKKWLTLGTDLLGRSDDRKRAVEGLVDELGAELGIPESERSRMRQLGTLLFDALGRELQDVPDPVTPPAPPAPAPQQR